jgi:hypothetical protein
VRRQHAPWLLLGILILAYGVGRWLGLFTAAFVLAAGYFASLRLHPRIACRTCKGAGRFYGAIYTWGFRMCPACLGTGRKVRYGASLFGSSAMKAEAVRARAAVAEAQRGHFTE